LKQKRSTYFLLIAVLGIWIFIGYRIFDFLEKPGEKLAQPEAEPLQIEEIQIDFEVESLRLDYPDPFLKNTGSKARRKYNSKPKAFPIARTEKPVINALSGRLEYFGYVRNNDGQVAIFQLDGKNRLLEKGSDIEGFRLQTIYEDSVIIRKEENSFCIKRNNRL
jgi:hypothetical protein